MAGDRKPKTSVIAAPKGVTGLKKKKPRKNFFKGNARYQTTVAGGGGITVAGGGGICKRNEKEFVHNVQDWLSGMIKEVEKVMGYGKEKFGTGGVHPTMKKYRKQDVAQKRYWDWLKKIGQKHLTAFVNCRNWDGAPLDFDKLPAHNENNSKSYEAQWW